ncbi:hypothetical protein [Streptomyces sp. NPDC056190]|uniref:hypothetical protein n=1 Tax=Streptomyces sp. NPDC056190 TaxID=3345741 RepID=UPI0035DE4760
MDDDLAAQGTVTSREESSKGSSVAWGDSGENRLTGGEQGERVTQQGATEPSRTATRVVEFDAHLAPSSQATGQCDKAAFISEDTDVGTQSLSMTNAWVVIDIETFRQAARGRRATRNECRVDTVDPPLATCEVAQEIRSH